MIRKKKEVRTDGKKEKSREISVKSTIKKRKEQRSSKQLEEVQRITEAKKCWNLGKSRIRSIK